jgi:hypothetical protein
MAPFTLLLIPEGSAMLRDNVAGTDGSTLGSTDETWLDTLALIEDATAVEKPLVGDAPVSVTSVAAVGLTVTEEEGVEDISKVASGPFPVAEVIVKDSSPEPVTLAVASTGVIIDEASEETVKRPDEISLSLYKQRNGIRTDVYVRI